MKNIYKCRICGVYTETPIHCNRPAKLLLDGKRRLALSKLVSFILRHDPLSAGLTLDKEGWIKIKDLVYGIKNIWVNRHLYSWVTEEHILALAILDPKGRFEIKNGRIRARYGHSQKLKVEISYSIDNTSKVLYHGTIEANLKSILSKGLKPMRRQFVHLSVNVEDAYEVARRHGERIVILVIDCDCLRKHGISIYKATDKIRLVKYVPPSCIIDIKKI